MLLLVQPFWKPLQVEYPKCGLTVTFVSGTVSALTPVLPGSSRGALIPADNRDSERAQHLDGRRWAALTQAEGSPSWTWAQLEWGTSGSLPCLTPHERVCHHASAAWWQRAWVTPEPAQTAQWVESCLLLAGHRGRGPGVLQGMSVWGAAAWLCLNSHLSYTGITTSSGTKVVAGLLRSWWGAEVVMATTLHGRFFMLGFQLGEQNCLVSSITECGNINDRVWALLYMTRFKVPITLIFFSSASS